MLFDRFTRSIARVVLASYITQTLAPVVYASETMVIQRQMPKEFQPRTLHLKSPHVPLQKAAEILPRTEQLFVPKDDDRIKAQKIIRNFHQGNEPGSLMAAQSQAFQYQLHVNTSTLQDQKFRLELSRKQKDSSGSFEQLHTATLDQGKLTSYFSDAKDIEEDALLFLFKGGSIYRRIESDRSNLFSWCIPGFATLNLDRDGRVFLNQDASAPILSSYDLVLKTSGELLIESLQVAALTLNSPITNIVGVISPNPLRLGTVIVDSLHANHEVINQGVLHVREKLTGSGKLINQSIITLEGTREAPAILDIRHVVNEKNEDMPVDVKFMSQHLHITPENHSFINEENGEFNVAQSLTVDSSTGVSSSFTNRGKVNVGDARLKRDATNTGSWKAHQMIAEKSFTNKDDLEIQGYLTASFLSNLGKIKAQKLFVKQDQFENSGSLDLEYFEVNGGRFCNKPGSTLHVQKNILAKLEQFVNEGTMRGDGLFEQVGGHFTNKGTWIHKGDVYSEMRIFSNTGTITWERGNWRWAPRTFFENEGKWTLKSMDVREGLSLPRNRGELHLESTSLVRADLHNHASGKVFARTGSNLRLNKCTNEGLIESDKGSVQIQELQNQTSGTITVQNGGTLEVEEGQNSGLIQGKDLSVTITEEMTNEGRMVLKRLLGKKTDLYGYEGYFINQGDLHFESTENDPAIMSVPHLDNVTKEKLKKAKITGTNILVTSENEKFRNYAGAEVSPKRLVFALPQETVFVDPALQPCLKGLPQFFNKGYIRTEVLELSRNLSENSGVIETNSFKPRGWRFQNLRGSKLDVRKSIETNLNTIQNAGEIIGCGKHKQKTGEFINTGRWEHTGDIDLGSTKLVNNKGKIAWRNGRWSFLPQEFTNHGTWILDKIRCLKHLSISNYGTLHLKNSRLNFQNLFNRQDLILSGGQYTVSGRLQNDHLMLFLDNDWTFTDDSANTAPNRLVLKSDALKSYHSPGEIKSQHNLTYDVQALPKQLSSQRNVIFSEKHSEGRTLADLMRVHTPHKVVFFCPGTTTTQDYEFDHIGHLSLIVTGDLILSHSFKAPVLTLGLYGRLRCGTSNSAMGAIAATEGPLRITGCGTIDALFGKIYGAGPTIIESLQDKIIAGYLATGKNVTDFRKNDPAFIRNGSFIASGDTLTLKTQGCYPITLYYGQLYSVGDLTLDSHTVYNGGGSITSTGKILHHGFEYRQFYGATADALDDVEFETNYLLNISSTIRSGKSILQKGNKLTEDTTKTGGYFAPLMKDKQHTQYLKDRGFTEYYGEVHPKDWGTGTGVWEYANSGMGQRPSVLQSGTATQLNIGNFVITGIMSSRDVSIQGPGDGWFVYTGDHTPVIVFKKPQFLNITAFAQAQATPNGPLLLTDDREVKMAFPVEKPAQIDWDKIPKFMTKETRQLFQKSHKTMQFFNPMRSLPDNSYNLLIQSVLGNVNNKLWIKGASGKSLFPTLLDTSARFRHRTQKETMMEDDLLNATEAMFLYGLQQVGSTIQKQLILYLPPNEINTERGVYAEKLDVQMGGTVTVQNSKISAEEYLNLHADEKLTLLSTPTTHIYQSGSYETVDNPTAVVCKKGPLTAIGKTGFQMRGSSLQALYRLIAGSTEGNTEIEDTLLHHISHHTQIDSGGCFKGDTVTQTTHTSTSSHPSKLESESENVAVICSDKGKTRITGSHIKALMAILLQGKEIETNARAGISTTTTHSETTRASSSSTITKMEQSASFYPTVLEALEVYIKTEKAIFKGTDFIADVLYDSTKDGASLGPTIATLEYFQQMLTESPLAKSDVGCKGGQEAMQPCRLEVKKIIRLLDEGKINLDAILSPPVTLADDNTQRIVHIMPGIDNACGFYSLLTGHPDFKPGDNPRELVVRKLQEGLKDKDFKDKICELLAPEIRELFIRGGMNFIPGAAELLSFNTDVAESLRLAICAANEGLGLEKKTAKEILAFTKETVIAAGGNPERLEKLQESVRINFDTMKLLEEEEIAWAQELDKVSAYIEKVVAQSNWMLGYGGAFEGDQKLSGVMDAIALVLGINFKIYENNPALDTSPLKLVYEQIDNSRPKTIELRYTPGISGGHFDRLEPVPVNPVPVANAKKDAPIDEGVIKFESVLWNKDRTQIIGKLAETTYQLKQWQTSWAHHEQLIPDEALVVVALGVALATQGWGASLVNSLSASMFGTVTTVSAAGVASMAPAIALSATSAAMVSAGFSTICVQAATSLLRTGDLIQVGKDLTSKQGIQSLAISVASAGLCSKLGGMLDIDMNPGLKTFTEHLQEHALRSTVDGVLNVAIGDMSVDKAIPYVLKQISVKTAAAYAANWIGSLYDHKTIGFSEHKVLHGALGGASGWVIDPTTKGFASGAMGAVLSETVAEFVVDREAASREVIIEALREGRTLTPKAYRAAFREKLRLSTDLVRIGTATAAAVLGQDPTIAMATATNALDNNCQAALPSLAVLASAVEAVFGPEVVLMLGLTADKEAVELRTLQLMELMKLTAILTSPALREGVIDKTKQEDDPSQQKATSSASSGLPPEDWKPEDKKPQVVRKPASIQDKMALDAAKRGEGKRIIEELNDPNFRGMEKWEYKVKSSEGRDSVVHYVRDPKSGRLMDFKFKKTSID